jgi:ATP-dependent RNA helicase DeaD
VQKAVIAPELRSSDLLVSAQTGSGKTVAFGMSLAPTLLGNSERLNTEAFPLALVIAPTRELAIQIQGELEWLFEVLGATIISCVGGMDMRNERRALGRGSHIVVGTPGRLCDHLKRGSLDLSQLKAVVLDEADEMLHMGFRDELEFILKETPSDRRTLMFSATVPKSIINLTKRYQKDAVRISTVSDKEQHHDIEYCAFKVSAKDRENAIINVLRMYDVKTAIVFCATRATVNRMTSRFNNRGFSVVALSGELSQGQRTRALQSIRDGRVRVCIATDVAARGIDLPNLDLVIHADLPKNRESLLHRSGRTGRAGRKGTAALIVPHNAQKRIESLFKSAKIDANWSNPPTVKEIRIRDDERIATDPLLTLPLDNKELAFAETLLGAHSAQQIAGAFIRLHRLGQSAPEEIIDTKLYKNGTTVDERRGLKSSRKNSRGVRNRSKDSFEEGVWFSLSVGRKHTAEARWLLPAIIKAGNIEKRDVGAIKIQENQTYFEIATDSADKFMEALGPNKKLEKSMSVNRIGGYPEALSDRDEPSLDGQQSHRNEKKAIGGKSRAFIRSNIGQSEQTYGYRGTVDRKYRFKGKKSDSPSGSEDPSEFTDTEHDRKALKTEKNKNLILTASNGDIRGNKKRKKSNKVRKNKGKRKKNKVAELGKCDQPEFHGDLQLKIGKLGKKTRARVTRKGEKYLDSGSSPLKRKN